MLPAVLADDVQIPQVVLNLARNAVEAMEPVERRELSIGTRAMPDQSIVEVTVAYTGPGIASAGPVGRRPRGRAGPAGTDLADSPV
jgi:C4-dicarboxylate-specific signal transduction histidine kinase